MRAKKGLSMVVTTLLLVLLSIVLIGILWAVISNLVQNSVNKTESCFSVQNKVNINDANTCYDVTTKELQFSVEITDIDLDGVLISIGTTASSKSFTMDKSNSSIPNVRPYTGSYGNEIKLPDKNSAQTYFYNMTGAGFAGAPTIMKIVPIVNGNQCDVSDTITEITPCTSF
jgi:hypothetical protein